MARGMKQAERGLEANAREKAWRGWLDHPTLSDTVSAGGRMA